MSTPTGWSRWRLRTWSPDYDRGARLEQDGDAEPRVDPDVEVPAGAWRPVGPPARPCAGPPVAPGPVAFVDGVQRIDAWADLEGSEGESGEALFASHLAGAVVVGRRRACFFPVGPARRAVFGAGPGGPVGDYHRSEGAGRSEDALQAARDSLEVEVALAVAEQLTAGGGLVVVDGPLHDREHVSGAIGLVKSHRREYLTRPDLRAVLTSLRPGQRTPVFALDTGWARWSWYLRLPGPAAEGWAGIVRCEASGAAGLESAVALAERSAATLPRFASSPVKDQRAPQNLVPIGSLERWLRHRLGDRDVLERRLRVALARR